jgi:hypothetical protein
MNLFGVRRRVRVAERMGNDLTDLSLGVRNNLSERGENAFA